MEKTGDTLTPDMQAWLTRHKVFFVATAPLAADGHLNCSPKGGVVYLGDPSYAKLCQDFPPHRGGRAIIRVKITRVADSCGYAVPLLDFVAERDTLDRWTEQKGAEGLIAYRDEKNRQSIDGLLGYKK